MSQALLDLIREKISGAFPELELSRDVNLETNSENNTASSSALNLFESKLNYGKAELTLDSRYWTEAVVSCLQNDSQLQFDLLSCITGVDYPDRMEVIYQFYSTILDQYATIKVITEREDPQVISLAGHYRTADWHERETYDLLGIEFSGHPNLRRILLTDDWQGYPLRKDYSDEAEE